MCLSGILISDWAYLFSEPFIEGIGNEVLLSILVFASLIGFILVHQYRARRAAHVHPEHLENVRNFRLNVGRLSEEEINRRVAAAREKNDKTCAICMCDACYSCLTNCGHLFCCDCIDRYWRHRGNILRPVDCAYCRTPVTVLLPVDWPERNEADSSEHYSQNVNRLDEYNHRFSRDRPYADYFADIPVMIPFLVRNMFQMDGIWIMFRLRMIVIFSAVIVYALLPLDILPESIYGIIGFLDDIFIIALLFAYLALAVRHFLARRFGDRGQNAEPEREPGEAEALNEEIGRIFGIDLNAEEEEVGDEALEEEEEEQEENWNQMRGIFDDSFD